MKAEARCVKQQTKRHARPSRGDWGEARPSKEYQPLGALHKPWQEQRAHLVLREEERGMGKLAQFCPKQPISGAKNLLKK